MADTILQIVQQEAIEAKYNRKLIDGQIRDAISADSSTQAQINKGMHLLHEWCDGTYYDSKQARVEQVKLMDSRELITNLFVGIAYFQYPALLTSVTAMLAGRLGWDDKREAIQTMAEILAVLCMTDAFDITKADKMASLMLVSRIFLPPEVIQNINQSQYLPPMVCEPLELKHNFDSGYLSHRDSLILGKGNHHSGDICLDVLNKLNKIALRLDTDFLLEFEEQPTFDLDTGDKRDFWQSYKDQSTRFYALMCEFGNEFYLTHKVDKRGRIYSQGYHIDTQGAAYKKAIVELSKAELIEGVPQ